VSSRTERDQAKKEPIIVRRTGPKNRGIQPLHREESAKARLKAALGPYRIVIKGTLAKMGLEAHGTSGPPHSGRNEASRWGKKANGKILTTNKEEIYSIGV